MTTTSLSSIRLFGVLGAAAAILLGASSASADLIPDGKTYVPLELTLDGQAAFKDTTMVLVGCNSPGTGRHQVAFAEATKPLQCSVKMAPVVYAVANKDLKPLQDLVAKDVGWAAEGIEARKLLEKTPKCGSIEETTLVDKSKNITLLTARYSVEKKDSKDTPCSIKKIGETITQTSSSAAVPSPATSASTAPPATSASAAPASSAPPAAKSGCSVALGSSSSSCIFGLGLALASVIVLRRRTRRAV